MADAPELAASTERLPQIRSALEVAQDELQAMCDRVQDLRRKIYNAPSEVSKALYKGQLIEVVRQLENRRLDLSADGIVVFVTHSAGGCPIRVNRTSKNDFFEA